MVKFKESKGNLVAPSKDSIFIPNPLSTRAGKVFNYINKGVLLRVLHIYLALTS